MFCSYGLSLTQRPVIQVRFLRFLTGLCNVHHHRLNECHNIVSRVTQTLVLAVIVWWLKYPTHINYHYRLNKLKYRNIINRYRIPCIFKLCVMNTTIIIELRQFRNNLEWSRFLLQCNQYHYQAPVMRPVQYGNILMWGCLIYPIRVSQLSCCSVRKIHQPV